jgi:hypothetical protein
MPIDLSRLTRPAAELDEARVALDGALVARASGAPDGVRVVEAARRRVAAAQAALDAVRLAELAAVSLDQLALSLRPDDVLALFPVTVEAKLEPGRRLRVRFWPDTLATATHDPRLHPAEAEAGRRWLDAHAAAHSEDARQEAWAVLAEAVGATRAAWVAHLFETQPSAIALVDDAAPFVPRASLVPDRFVLSGFVDGARVLQVQGAPIPHDLANGLDTTPSEVAGLNNAEGRPIQLPPRMRWLTDFAEAQRVGMAIEVALPPTVTRLDHLIVFGVRVTETPAQSAAGLASLLEAHRYSRGLAFVPVETPTNNSREGGAGLPGQGERVRAGYTLERQPRAFAGSGLTHGEVSARAFGVPADSFARVAESGATATLAAEPQGREPACARAMSTALFDVTVGPLLEDLIGVDAARAERVRDHFCAHVRASGPLPTLRVGRQPYGVLPVTSLGRFKAEASEAIDDRLLPIVRAARVWWHMLREDELYGGTPEEALRTLARSTELYAEVAPQRPTTGGHNHFARLAGTLARSSRNSLRADWLTAPLNAFSEGKPVPVARPVVDAGTRAALSTLARATPHSVLSAPLPESVLARMLRHALLLEWGRFARGVLLQSLDRPSQVNLQTRAKRDGLAAYITTLAEAMAMPRERPEAPGRTPVREVLGREVLGREGPGREVPGRDLPVRGLPGRDVGPVRPATDVLDEQEKARVRALVGSFERPLASTVGGPRLRAFLDALALLAELPEAQLLTTFFGVLDVATRRIDAWSTSFASARLATVRARSPQGVVIGAWGYLQDVGPADAAASRPEHIHAPSADHAAAAAVLRSAALRAKAAGSAHADIDLSSRRVRQARWLLEGLREGRSLGELLGLRLERSLKGTAAEPHLEPLRQTFALRGGRRALDGLSLHGERPWTDAGAPRAPGLPARGSPAGAAIEAGLRQLDEALDALTDSLTAEAVYQLVRGNPGAALLDLDGIAQGETPPPPRLEVTETPPSSARLLHRVLVALPESAWAPGWPVGATVRGRAEPILDAWCGALLGPADQTVLMVETGERPVPVMLSQLGLSAIDVVLTPEDELSARLLRAAGAGGALRADRAWRDLLALTAAARAVLSRAEPLSADSLELGGPLPMTSGADEDGDLPARVQAAHAALLAVRDALRSPVDPSAALLAAAEFGLRAPGSGAALLLAEAESRLSAFDRADTTRSRWAALFARELPGVVAVRPRDPSAFAAPVLDGPVAPAAWLDGIGRVRAGADRLGALLRHLEVTRDASSALTVAQAPARAGERWIATHFDGAETVGRLSMLLHTPLGLDPTRAVGGLVVDAWSEPIPARARDTAMALRFNAPNTRAPQAILLAVCPDLAAGWSTELLVSIIADTLDHARLRMLPPTTLTRSGHRPMVYLGQRADGSGVSFSL